MELLNKILDGRLRITKKLGEGGMGVVYSAVDLFSNKTVAVKILKPNKTSTYMEDIVRFKKEVEILSTFDHKNIIKMYGTGEYENVPFMVVEMLEGENLSSLLKKSHSFSQSEAVEIIKQVTEALEYVHDHGILHRDIKPGNVLITSTGDKNTVKLLDFGISHIMELGRMENLDEILGTFGYISPEASGILSNVIDERSDLYSVGVMFYQLITEEMPFKEKSIRMLLHHQVAYTPVRPITLNPTIPEALDEIIMKLLNKDPNMRYQSATGLMYDLKRLEDGERSFPVGSKDQRIKLSYNTKLIGRDKELNSVKLMLERAVNGFGGMLLISGEAGIGKTKLVEAFKEYSYNSSAIFIRGRCLNQSNKMPYQLFKDAIDEFIALWDTWESEVRSKLASKLEKKLGELIGVLLKLNPRLEKVVGEVKKLQPLEPERENQRFLNVISDLLCSIGSNTEPLVLLLEDLHWADEESVNIIELLIENIKFSNILVIGTYRNNEINDEHGLYRIRESYCNDSDTFQEIYLKSLEISEINKLLSLILCGSSDDSIMLAEFVHKKSAGNPLFAIQMIRDMVESKSIVWDESQWQGDWNKLRGFYISGSIIDIILKRAEKLTYEQLKLVCTASVFGREFDIEFLCSLMDSSKEETIKLVDEVIKLHLFEKSHEKGKIAFTHDRIRDAFYQKIDQKEKIRLHHSIAQLYEASSKKDEAYFFDLAHHYIEGEDTDKALVHLLPAAEIAQQNFAYDTAIRFYIMAVKFLEEKGRIGGMEWCCAQESLAEIYIIVGNCSMAISGLNGLLEFTSDNVSKARILKKLGNAYYKISDWDRAEELITQGLAILGEKIPVKTLDLFWKLLKELILHFIFLKIVRVPRSEDNNSGFSKGKYSYVENKADRIENNVLPNKNTFKHKQKIEASKEILSLYKSMIHVFIFKTVGASNIYLFLRCLNISIKNHMNINDIGETIGTYSIMLSVTPFSKRSAKYFELASKIFHMTKDDWRYYWNIRNMGFLISWAGKRNESIKCFEEARNFFEKIGDYWELSIVYDGLVENYYFCSDYKRCLEIANQNLKIRQKIDEVYGICNAKTELALPYIDKGEYATAEALLIEALNESRENKLWFIYCISLIYLGYMECERLNFDRAIEYLSEAMKVYESNTFMKDYTVWLYSKLAEALVKKCQGGSNIPFSSWSKEQKNTIRKLLNKSLKQSRAWPNQYGVALRIAAYYKGLEGRWKASERTFEKSLEILKKAGRKFEEAKTLMDYAFILEKTGRGTEARERLTTAYKIFKSIGVNTYAEKCSIKLGYHGIQDMDNFNLAGRDRLAWDIRMDTVLTTSRHLSSILDIDNLMEKILVSTIELVGAQRGLLFVYSQNGERTLELKAVRNFSDYEIKNRSFEISTSILEQIEKEKAPVIISDAISDERLKRQISIIQSGIRSVLCAPIITRGEMLGIIYLDNNLVSGLFTDDDIKILDIISNQAGVSIDNARLYNQLKRYSKEIEESRNEVSQLNRDLELRVEERTRELQLLNDEMANVNLQLRKYADTIEELSVVRERNRMAKDVHDTVGHSMALLLTLLEVSKVSCVKDVDKTVERLEEAAEIARTSLEKIRRSISGLVPEELEENNIVAAIESMINNFKYTGVEFNFSVGKTAMKIPTKYATIIFRCCQESVTNALRHGRPTEIDIVLKLANNKIKLFIADNGKGCMDIEEGLGLRSMRQRIASVSGVLRYGSDGKEGFYINIEIPIEDS